MVLFETKIKTLKSKHQMSLLLKGSMYLNSTRFFYQIICVQWFVGIEGQSFVNSFALLCRVSLQGYGVPEGSEV